MKFIFATIILSICQNTIEEIKIVETRHYSGAIFPKTYDMPYSENPTREQRFTPTIKEIDEMEIELRQFFKKMKSTNNSAPHKNLKKYVRQYIGFINQDGNRIVYLSARWDGYSLIEMIKGYSKPTDSWKENWIITFDGGNKYWQIKYNLDKGEFFDHMVNGVA